VVERLEEVVSWKEHRGRWVSGWLGEGKSDCEKRKQRKMSFQTPLRRPTRFRVIRNSSSYAIVG